MKAILASLLLIASFTAQAATDSNTSQTQLTTESVQVAPAGLIPYLGVNGGYTGTDSSAPIEGAPTSLKLLGSYYLTMPLVFDLGVGIANQQFSNSNALHTSSSATVFEAAGRYVFDNRWQAGIVFNQFAEQGNDYGASQGDAQFAGLQALKEFNFTNDTLARIGGRVQTLTNNTGTTVNMFMAEFQIGYDFGARKQSVSSSPSNAALVTPTRYNEVPVKNETALLALSKEAAPQFDTSKSDIGGVSKSRLEKVAKVLKNNPGLVGQIEVQGRADSSGNAQSNQKLSERRALAVKDYLHARGVNVEVVAAGLGAKNKPVEAIDRRADLIFKDVKDEAILKKELSTVR